jgi:hypothetical protein
MYHRLLLPVLLGLLAGCAGNILDTQQAAKTSVFPD